MSQSGANKTVSGGGPHLAIADLFRPVLVSQGDELPRAASSCESLNGVAAPLRAMLRVQRVRCHKIVSKT